MVTPAASYPAPASGRTALPAAWMAAAAVLVLAAGAVLGYATRDRWGGSRLPPVAAQLPTSAPAPTPAAAEPAPKKPTVVQLQAAPVAADTAPAPAARQDGSRGDSPTPDDIAARLLAEAQQARPLRRGSGRIAIVHADGATSTVYWHGRPLGEAPGAFTFRSGRRRLIVKREDGSIRRLTLRIRSRRAEPVILDR